MSHCQRELRRRVVVCAALIFLSGAAAIGCTAQDELAVDQELPAAVTGSIAQAAFSDPIVQGEAIGTYCSLQTAQCGACHNCVIALCGVGYTIDVASQWLCQMGGIAMCSTQTVCKTLSSMAITATICANVVWNQAPQNVSRPGINVGDALCVAGVCVLVAGIVLLCPGPGVAVAGVVAAGLLLGSDNVLYQCPQAQCVAGGPSQTGAI